MPNVVLNPGYLANALARGFEVGYKAAITRQETELAKQREQRLKEAQEFEQYATQERLNIEAQRLKTLEETERYRRKLLDLQAKAQELKNQSFQQRLAKLPEIARNMQDVLMAQLGFDKDTAEDIAAMMAVDPELALKTAEGIIKTKTVLEEATKERWTPTRTIITTNPQTKTTFATILMASNKGNTKAITMDLGRPLPSVYLQMIEESSKNQGSRLIRQPYTIYVRDPIGTKAITLFPDQNGKIPALIVDENKKFEWRMLTPEEADKLEPETDENKINEAIQKFGVPLEDVAPYIDLDQDMKQGGQIDGIQP